MDKHRGQGATRRSEGGMCQCYLQQVVFIVSGIESNNKLLVATETQGMVTPGNYNVKQLPMATAVTWQPVWNHHFEKGVWSFTRAF